MSIWVILPPTVVQWVRVQSHQIMSYRPHGLWLTDADLKRELSYENIEYNRNRPWIDVVRRQRVACSLTLAFTAHFSGGTKYLRKKSTY